jgi:hypothetical protein
MTYQSSRQRGRYNITKPQQSEGNFKEKEKLVEVPDGRLTPGQTGRQTVGLKLTSTSIKQSTFRIHVYLTICVPRHSALDFSEVGQRTHRQLCEQKQDERAAAGAESINQISSR